jgi:hypothetical protein
MDEKLQEEIAYAILASEAVKYEERSQEEMKESYKSYINEGISPIPSAILAIRAIRYDRAGRSLLHKLFNEFKEDK